MKSKGKRQDEKQEARVRSKKQEARSEKGRGMRGRGKSGKKGNRCVHNKFTNECGMAIDKICFCDIM